MSAITISEEARPRKRVISGQANLTNQELEAAKQLIHRSISVCHVTKCWNWTKTKNAQGYGRAYIFGMVCPAHRLSYLAYYGPHCNGNWTLHRCDNPTCVNPDHLYSGSPSDNANDAVKRHRHPTLFKTGNPIRTPADRHARGSAVALAKLTEEKVREIKKTKIEKGFMARLAREYKVSFGTIWNIFNGETWTHVK